MTSVDTMPAYAVIMHELRPVHYPFLLPCVIHTMSSSNSFPAASYIRQIGRGARGARGLSQEEAHSLYAAMLAGRVSDLELGAIVLSYRIKGETAQELGGMLDAVHQSMELLDGPSVTPVVIPTYNGARKRPNLVPLLALLLARRGIPVLMHGITTDPERVTSADILKALGLQPAQNRQQIVHALQHERLAFAPIEVLAPTLALQLALRGPLGVRNSAHTLAKMLQPFKRPALRLVSYTHTAYRDTLLEYFSQPNAAGLMGVMLGRGTEGEAAADPALPRESLWVHALGQQVQIPAADSAARQTPPQLDALDAASTARWITAVLAGEIATPEAIATQVQAIADIVEDSGQ